MDELRQLNAGLRRSRERLVLAREEERRRIRRDLHDDLAPTLAGLALDADTVAELVPSQPARAEALARTLNEQIRAAVGVIRQLVHDLRPPALDEYGLLAALRQRAQQLSAGGQLTVVVEAPERLPVLPAAVEVAAYRIVQEALMNILRHAEGRRCTVTIALGTGLEIVVADDGVGMVSEHPLGVGLRSMHKRAEELGGQMELEAPHAGGTVGRVWLPLPEEETP
jgi:signal transduction histidine kinase